MKNENGRKTAYKVFSVIILVILAFLFLFPLYWIVTGAFKPSVDIYATEPKWLPSEWVMNNFDKLMNKRSAPCGSLRYPSAAGSPRTGTPSISGRGRWYPPHSAGW